MAFCLHSKLHASRVRQGAGLMTPGRHSLWNSGSTAGSGTHSRFVGVGYCIFRECFYHGIDKVEVRLDVVVDARDCLCMHAAAVWPCSPAGATTRYTLAREHVSRCVAAYQLTKKAGTLPGERTRTPADKALGQPVGSSSTLCLPSLPAKESCQRHLNRVVAFVCLLACCTARWQPRSSTTRRTFQRW